MQRICHIEQISVAEFGSVIMTWQICKMNSTLKIQALCGVMLSC
jgi:hypothetical protein